jgi:hypothetical protein
VELTPGHAHHPPAFGGERAIPRAVRLEGGSPVVDGAAVELDDQPLPPPEAVDLDETVSQVDGRVQLRLRKPFRRMKLRKRSSRRLFVTVVPRAPAARMAWIVPVPLRLG